MQRFQLTVQKIVIFGCILFAVLSLVYTLGFSTDLAALSYHSDPGSGLFYVPGAELYLTVQPYNRDLMTYSIAYICLAITLFVTLTHRRRLYYVSNYITSLAFAGYSFFLGSDIASHAREYKELYTQIDFERMEQVTTMMKIPLVNSTFFLDAGIVLSFIMIGWAALIILNLVFKAIWQSTEKWAPEVA